MIKPHVAELGALVLAASGLAGCTTCTERETTSRVEIPHGCTAGRCEEWKSAPCEETCAAFLDDRALEVTGCEPPRVDPRSPGRLTVECRYVTQTCRTSPSLGSGRPQAGHVARGPARGEDAVGRLFAAAAEAEESSVHAFIELAAVLEAFGAPASLVARCGAAADDEERHRATMSALARARGVEASRAPPAPSRWPTIESLAIENAAVGCVEELWSAAIVAHAAHFASAPEVRAAYRAIARDEARHAALAFAIDTYARSRLDADALGRVVEARAAAVVRLVGDALRVADDDPVVTSGLVPTRNARRRLLEAMFADDLAEAERCVA
ncbi:MAG: hypothetical protein KF819_04530 [Labilithrix sp.]|nr:hypothetical protein [Labilithrix sp.]